jgi:hypothetical protein
MNAYTANWLVLLRPLPDAVLDSVKAAEGGILTPIVIACPTNL